KAISLMWPHRKPHHGLSEKVSASSPDCLWEGAGFEPSVPASALHLSAAQTMRPLYVPCIDRVVPKTQEDQRLQFLPPHCRDTGKSGFFLCLLQRDAG